MDLHTDLTRTEMVALVSAVVTGVAAFLPWVAGVQAGPVEVGATRSGIEGLGLLTLLLAMVVIGAVLVFGTESRGPAATAIGGLIVVVVSLWKFIDLGDPVSPGIGLYLTVLGGVGMLVGGGLTYRARAEQPPTEASR